MMKVLRKQIFTFLIGAIVLCNASTLQAWQEVAAAQDKVQSLVNSYCTSCHGEQKSEGDLRLDRLSAKLWNDYDLFDRVVSRIEDGEMPPDDAKQQLSADAKGKLLSHLKSRLIALDDAQLAGRYKKLTAREYSNTVQDVLGHPIDKLRNLPFDSDNDFKKLGDHQVVTSYAVKKYYNVASNYLAKHILIEMPPVRTVTYSAKDNPKEFVLTSRFGKSPIGPVTGQGNPPAFMLRVPVNSYAEEGEYEVTFDWRCFYLPAKERFNHTKQYRSATAPNPPELSCRSRIRILNSVRQQKESRAHECRIDQPIRVVLDKETKFISFRVNGSSFMPREIDPRQTAIEKSDLPKAEKQAAIKALRQKIKQENKGKDRLCMLITRATFRGPLGKTEPPSHALIFGEVKRGDSFDACPPIIRRLASRLFRRPVSDAILAKYNTIARAEYTESKNVYLAVRVALNAMLCSPHFIFKYEGNQRDLDDYMIAARLSYLLWNSSPDAELLNLASNGKLKDPAVRRQQALRLLNDREKSERFTGNFTHQWLGLKKFGEYTPNEAYISSSAFANLKPHMAREPQEFFDEVLFNNLSALNFIDSDFVVWSRRLYGHYQAKDLKVQLGRDAEQDEFRRMALSQNPGRIRGGLPTMASIMSLTTDGENTHPILRGVWVARRMLGIEIEPPASVPAIEVNLENVSKPREILAKHKEDRSCYACHVKFDHFGLALENYDVIGRWKTDYVHPVQNEKGKFTLVKKDPIDSLAETPDGKPMHSVQGVKDYLMANKDTVMRNLVEKLFSYALGREVRYKDRAQIETLLHKMKENDYKLQDLILELVASQCFTQR